MGYLNINKNALHDLKYCDTTYGLNGSLPADLLHTFQLGIYIYAVDGLFGEKKASVIGKNNFRRKARKLAQNTEIDVIQENDGQNLQGADKSSHNIFNQSECDYFDNLSRIYGKHLTRQSDRNLPRTFFPTGVTSDKKKMEVKCKAYL